MDDFSIVLLCVPALFILALGASVFITRRPVVLQSRYVHIATLLCAVPIFLLGLAGLRSPLVIFWLALMAFSWRASSGFAVYGISVPAMREALVAVLGKLHLDFSEDMTGITLADPGARLRTILSELGVSRLRTSDKVVRPLLKQIADELKLYFRANQVKMAYTFNIGYIALAIVILATCAIDYAARDNSTVVHFSQSTPHD